MFRYILMGAGGLLLVAAGFFFWISRTGQESLIPAVAKAATANAAAGEPEEEESADPGAPPPPDERSREQKRFDRADKDRNGRITKAELLEPRRKPFARLDTEVNWRDARHAFATPCVRCWRHSQGTSRS